MATASAVVAMAFFCDDYISTQPIGIPIYVADGISWANTTSSKSTSKYSTKSAKYSSAGVVSQDIDVTIPLLFTFTISEPDSPHLIVFKDTLLLSNFLMIV